MNICRNIAIYFVITILVGCKQSSSKENKTVNGEKIKRAETIKITDSINKIDNNITDIILYKNDKGFDALEAEKAEHFVLTKMDLMNKGLALYETGYNVTDNSYNIQLGSDDKKNNRVWFSYYIYYPKTKTIIHGILFDTLYHNNKLYKHYF